MFKALEEFIPDFSIGDEQICKDNIIHELMEIYQDNKIQILKCNRCDYMSVGYYEVT